MKKWGKKPINKLGKILSTYHGGLSEIVIY